MFKSVEDVQNTPVKKLVELVKEVSYGASYEDILDAEIHSKYSESLKVVNETQRLAEKIAFAIRDKVEGEFQPEDEEDEDYVYENDLTHFMQAIAYESDEIYTDFEYETHPDQFWKPSTC